VKSRNHGGDGSGGIIGINIIAKINKRKSSREY